MIYALFFCAALIIFVVLMIRLASFIISSLIVFSLSLNTLVLSHFEYNYEYIVSELCVEKDVKDSCCKGSCHLAAEFSKVDPSASDMEISFVNSVELLNWFQSKKLEEKKSAKPLLIEYKGFSRFSLLKGNCESIDHPPAVVI